MATDPNSLTNLKDIRTLLANAERLGVTELANKCRRRIIELGGGDSNDPLTVRLWQAVTAYEEILERKHSKSQKATYTRRKIRDKGTIATLTDWALSPKVTPGFLALIEDGLAEFTGEYIVLEFAKNFPDGVVESAKLKLLSAGFDINNIVPKNT